MHFNLHKTFSTPHGGGGPGAGPVAVSEQLAPFLPGPRVVRDDGRPFRLERPGERPSSIGRVRAYQGSVGVLVRAYAYIRAHGGDGPARGQRGRGAGRQLPAAAPGARRTSCPSTGPASTSSWPPRERAREAETGVRTLDVAKRLIDHGFHPPTIYFPLIVEECLLIEPTETESLETLDAFADALLAIAAEAHERPGAAPRRPARAPVRRLDEATAARQPELRWRPMTGAETPCPT